MDKKRSKCCGWFHKEENFEMLTIIIVAVTLIYVSVVSILSIVDYVEDKK